MKTVIAMVLLGVCNVFAAEETNPAPVLVTISTNLVPVKGQLKLTPQMERLNKSPYFNSWINEFKGFILSRTKKNVVGSPYERPVIHLDAMRYLHVNGQENFYLDLYSFAESPKYAFLFETNQVVEFMVDGARVTVQSLSGEDYFSYEPERSRSVGEGLMFPVPPQFLQALGAAKKVQMRVETKHRTDTRDLSATNLARFRIFAATFIDSNSLARASLAVRGK